MHEDDKMSPGVEGFNVSAQTTFLRSKAAQADIPEGLALHVFFAT
jgi:hypothetical protein